MSRTIRFVRRRVLAATALALFIALVLAVAPFESGADSTNGHWLVSATGAPPLPVNMAPARTGASMVFDSVHDRLVMIGGDQNGPKGDVWTLDLAQTSVWVQVNLGLSSAPAPRYGHMTVYDPVSDRIVLFGGFAGADGDQNDVWQLKLSGTPTWTQLAVTGNPPSIRQNGAAIYDPAGQRMIVFGGYSSNAGFLSDVYALSLSGIPQWTQLSPDGAPPPARDICSYAYDSDRGSMIVFGGWNGNYLGDTWELTLAGSGSWAPISASGAPSARREAVGAYDASTQRFVIFGGRNPDYIGESWQLSLADSAQWTRLSTGGTGPSPRGGAAGCVDPIGDRFAVFGGYDGTYCSDLRFLSLSSPETWSCPFSVAGGLIPPRRENASVIWPETRQMFTFGGASYGTYNNETWTLDATSPNHLWIQIAQSGVAPSPRRGHRAVWDPVRHRMLVFGGFDGVHESDLWGFSPLPIPSWAQFGTVGTPPTGRMDFGLAYDALRDQLIVVGGNAGTPTYLNDVWALPLSGGDSLTWSALAPSGSPPDPRWIYGMQYDPAGDRMVFFGGETAGGAVNDAWALNLSGSPSWTQLLPSGTPPTGRWGHAAIYDPRNRRMVVFGGYDGTYQNDVWALQLGDSPAWSRLAPLGALPTGRNFFSAVFDVAGNQMLLMGGWSGSQQLADTWALAWDLPATAVPSAPPDLRFALEGAHPNPSEGNQLTIAFSLPRAERARLDVLDLAGRRVASRDVGAAAGRQVITVTPQRALNPGVYLVKLSASEGSRATKVSVMR